MKKRFDHIELSWRDTITTFLAALVVFLYLVKTNTIYISFLPSNRFSIFILAIVSLLMCSFSSFGVASYKDPLIKIASYLGLLGLVLIIFGIISGNTIFFELLSFTIVLFWLIMTIHHYFRSIKKYLHLDSKHRIGIR